LVRLSGPFLLEPNKRKTVAHVTRTWPAEIDGTRGFYIGTTSYQRRQQPIHLSSVLPFSSLNFTLIYPLIYDFWIILNDAFGVLVKYIKIEINIKFMLIKIIFTFSIYWIHEFQNKISLFICLNILYLTFFI
jgi:hypothetical protein